MEYEQRSTWQCNATRRIIISVGGRGDVGNRTNTISHIIEVENRLSNCLNKNHWRGTSSQKNGRVTKAVREWEQTEEGCGEPTMKRIVCVRGYVQVWASVRSPRYSISGGTGQWKVNRNLGGGEQMDTNEPSIINLYI